MEVITTHIQADFDSFASMLAAKLLYPDAVLVFSGAQEKIVRDYLQGAGVEITGSIEKLRHDRLDDITRLVLVDTKQASRIGVFSEIVTKPGLEIIIYDHHRASSDDITGTMEHCEQVGSTVALMVEELNRKAIKPSPEIATVMAMGIFEDTGSLLFPSTTPRDCMAYADLISWGADVNRVARMVSRELSPIQVDVLDQLIKNAGTYQINGIDILFTQSVSLEYVEDFAMLVHKLRPMFAVEAIFAFGQMGERIYFVARSSVPQINAADAAAIFGGGGHPSASAASVKDLGLDQAQASLLKHLKKIVKPRITARDIMTFPVKGVYLDSTIDDASDVLNKYNINAALVKSRDEKLLGLVTRQVVSRAQGHNLGGSKVMEYMIRDIRTVRPEASVGEIRSLVIDGFQRLLPVMDDKKVIGVITRTDLMRIMHEKMGKVEGRQASSSPKKYVQSLLFERLPKELFELLKKAGELAGEMGFNLFIVGGIVRDMVMRIDNLDIDLVVEGDGIAFAKELARMNGARIASHDKYKTAVLTLENGRHIDIATARLEYYKIPGGFPVVEESTLKLDLYRRDFTINTLAIALNPNRFGEMIDFFGGQRDIKEKRIRVLHSLSFVEDPSRILRAVRFEKRLGFSLGKQTLSLVHSAVASGFLNGIPGRRIFHEIGQILSENDPLPSMERLKDLGVLEAIHKGIIYNEQTAELFMHVKETLSWFNLLYTHERLRPWFVFIMALTDQMKPKTIIAIGESLGVGKEEIRQLLASKTAAFEIFKAFAIEKERTPAWVVNTVEGASLEEILFVMSKTRSLDMKERISSFITSWRHYKPPVTGKDLIELGFKQNKQLGVCLKEIRDRGLNGEIKDYNEAMLFAGKMLSGQKIEEG
ncbi:MAG TPA: CBS domain-containing protein [Desulfomonilia bacterium]